MEVNAVIFDMDGTLVDSIPRWIRVAEMYLENRGITPKPGLGKIVFPMTMQDASAYIKKEYGLPDDPQTIGDSIYAMMVRFYQTEAPLKGTILNYLNGLKERKMPMGVATVTAKKIACAAMERLNVLPYFESVVCTDDVGIGKESPLVYQTCAANLGAQPGKCMVFEDALHAIKTAKKAGFIAVGIYDETSKENWPEMLRTADICLENYDDFEGFAKKYLD